VLRENQSHDSYDEVANARKNLEFCKVRMPTGMLRTSDGVRRRILSINEAMRNMRSLIVIATAFFINSAHADTYTYVCTDHGMYYPLKVDDKQNTLAWKGSIYKIKPQEDCAKFGWRAEKDGASFDFCAATQGYADFEQKGARIQCKQTPEHLSTPNETKTFYDYISVVFSYVYTAFILIGVLSVIFFVFLLDARLNARGGSRSRSSGEFGSAGDATADSMSNQREEWVQIYGIQEGPDNNPHVSFFAVDGGRRVGQMPGTLVGNCGVKIQNVVYQMGYLKSGNMGTFKQRSAAPSSPFH
jgi:hypothetical protein